MNSYQIAILIELFYPTESSGRALVTAPVMTIGVVGWKGTI